MIISGGVCQSRLSLRFSDGSKVVVEDRLAEELEDVKDKRDADCEFKRYDYYPGQVLNVFKITTRSPTVISS